MSVAPPRILIAKAGLDGHDRGALLVCLALRDAGCEVLYTGIRNTPAQIVAAAIQEDVDGVGLSSLSGAHKALFPRVAQGLREAGAKDVALFAGGIFPKADQKLLLDAGIQRLFHPGAPLKEICDYCVQAAEQRRNGHSDIYGDSPRATAMRLTLLQDDNVGRGSPIAFSDVKQIEDLPAARILANGLLIKAIKENAEVIRIETMDFRLWEKDHWRQIPVPPTKYIGQLIAYFKCLAHLDPSEEHKPQQGNFEVVMERKVYRLSAKTERSNNGELMRIELVGPIQEEGQSPALRIIGVTGPGGTGKSTMIDAVIAEAIRRKEKIAVLCVDPSSIRSGGAFLGDRIRMQRHSAEPGVFVRSVATRGSAGGVPACVGPMAQLLRQSGYDWVFIETIGTGQDQVEIRKHVGRMILAAAPGQGDAVQIFKSNALEVADLVVVTRADQGRADDYAKEIRATLKATRRGEDVPVVVVSGERGTGVDQLMERLSK